MKMIRNYYLLSLMLIGTTEYTSCSIPNSVTGNVTGTFSFPTEIAITPDGTTAYVIDNGDPGTVSIVTIDKTVSPETAVITGTITDPTFEDSYAIAITPDGTKAYVANFNTGSASGPGTVTVIASRNRDCLWFI